MNKSRKADSLPADEALRSSEPQFGDPADEALRKSEQRFRALIERSHDAISLLAADGTILYDSPSVTRLLGYTGVERLGRKIVEYMHPDDRDRMAADFAKLVGRPGSTMKSQGRFLHKNGRLRWIESIRSNLLDEPAVQAIVANYRDVTERRIADSEREIAIKLLRLVSKANDRRKLLRSVTDLVRTWSGCDAVGIRLREGWDFPYFETRGFPAEFVRAENTLCMRDADGQPVRDVHGNPILECVCGHVLGGRGNSGLPCYTRGGSFWTNSTSELRATMTEADRPVRVRNCCNNAGYESVALIPLRVSGGILGLLQLNDRRSGRFAPRMISLLERLADSVALGLAHWAAQESLRESALRMETAARAGNVGLWNWDLRANRAFYSPEWKRQIGYGDREIGDSLAEWQDRVHPEDLERCQRTVQAFLAKPWPDYHIEFRLRHKDGSYRWILAQASLDLDEHGTPIRMLGSHIDITERKQVEEALRAAEERLKKAQQMAQIGNWEWNVRTGDLHWEEENYRIFGLPRETTPSVDTFLAAIHPEDRAFVERSIADALKGKPYDLDMRIRRPDGKERVVHANAELTRDTDGKPLRLFGTVQDVTERKQVEVALRNERDRAQRYLDTVEAIVVALDCEGRVTLINRKGCRLLGYREEELIGRSWFSTCLPQSGGMTHVYPQFLKLVAGELDSGEHIENPVVTRNGELRDIAWHNSLLRDEQGRIIGTLSAGEDVTERKRAEEALQAEAEFRRVIMQRAADGLCVCHETPDYPYVRFTVWNDRMEQITGYTMDEINRRGWYQSVSPDPEIQAKAVERMARIRQGDDLLAEEWEITRADGAKRQVQISTSLVRNGGGKVYVLALMHDITARKADEERLTALELLLTHSSRLAVMGELAAGIAHDVSQPLCAIVNFAKACKNLASSEAPDLPQICRWSDAIATTASLSGDIIRRMLSFARRHESTRERVAVAQLVADAMLLVRHDAKTQEITLRQEVPEEGLVVWADPVQIQQVLVGLLRNGIEALANMPPSDRQVAVQVRRTGEIVQISVSDNGSDQTAADLPKLFEPFFTTKPKGLGLGLSICQTIIEDHGGTIRAEANQGGGLTIHFTLPTGKDPPNHVSEQDGVRD